MSRQRPGPKTNRDLADIVGLHLATGCRIGEVLALRWEDVVDDGDRVLVTVAGTVVTPKSKGGGPTFRQPTPKSDASYRTIVLPPFAAAIARRRRELTGGSAIGGVFTTRNDTWKSPNNVRRQWRAARKGSAYEWVTPHVFRKTVATLVDKETDTKTASKLLGHGSEDVTDEFYVKKAALAPDVADILEQFAPPPVEGEEQAS